MSFEPYRPVPATVHDAVPLANQIAYGFTKHLDDGYWDALYEHDPAYCWDRMCGWMLQPGDPNAARFGLWAFPPTLWNVGPPPPSDGDGGIDVPVEIPAFSPNEFAAAVMARFDRIETAGKAFGHQAEAMVKQIEAALARIEAMHR